MEDVVTRVPCRAIRAGDNDRTTFDPEKLAELAKSIGDSGGLVQPITIRPVGRANDAGEIVAYHPDIKPWTYNSNFPPPDQMAPADGETWTVYEIVAGERRFRAVSGVLGWEAIQAFVRPMSDEEAAAIMLTENTAREDLNPIDEAVAYQKRMARHDWTVRDVADKAGVSTSRVKQRLALLDLIPDVQDLVRRGKMPLTYASVIAKLGPDTAALQLAALRLWIRRPEVSLDMYSRLVAELRDQHEGDEQGALFTVETWVEVPVLQTNGLNVEFNVPTNDALPPVPAAKGVDSGTVMYDYIEALTAAGFHEAAAAVGTVFTALVRARNISLPARALVPVKEG